MKKLLRLTVAALLLATSQVSTAQIKMAPNYFRADPAVYKYRKLWSGKIQKTNKLHSTSTTRWGALLRKNTKEVRVL